VQIHLRCRDEPHIDGDRAGSSHAHDLVRLEDAEELRLDRGRNVVDIVEEDRAATGELEQSRLGVESARIGAALVPEDFALEQFVGNRGERDGDEWTAATGATAVHIVGEEFLADARLSDQQDRAVRSGDRPDAGEQAQHRCALRDDARVG
jgi:hypothetical protein